MSQIHIAVAYGGAYEDSWETLMVASTDKAKIEKFVEDNESRVDRLKIIEIEVRKFLQTYDDLNPFDRSDYEKQVDVPKWPAGMDQRLITKEMRIERDTIREFNAQVAKRNSDRMVAHNQKRNVAMLEFALSIGLSKEDLPDFDPANVLSDMPLTSRLYIATNVEYRVDSVDEI